MIIWLVIHQCSTFYMQSLMYDFFFIEIRFFFSRIVVYHWEMKMNEHSIIHLLHFYEIAQKASYSVSHLLIPLVTHICLNLTTFSCSHHKAGWLISEIEALPSVLIIKHSVQYFKLSVHFKLTMTMTAMAMATTTAITDWLTDWIPHPTEYPNHSVGSQQLQLCLLRVGVVMTLWRIYVSMYVCCTGSSICMFVCFCFFFFVFRKILLLFGDIVCSQNNFVAVVLLSLLLLLLVDITCTLC